MARNHEKHYGRLNRLFLLKEKEEFEKANPTRPKLDLLNTPEEIQKWIPSIKKDIDFYLKKSKVTCYSDQQIEDCKLKIVQLEKEFKAFIRKIKKLTPGVLDVIPWSSRPYKRKKQDCLEEEPQKEFSPIATPLLNEAEGKAKQLEILDSPLSMDEPLIFNPSSTFNINSKPLNALESTNINLSEPESTSGAISEHNMGDNMSSNDIHLLENTILYQRHNEAFSRCFKSNSLLNQENNISHSAFFEKKSCSSDMIHNKYSSLNTTENSLCKKEENHKKRLCKHSPSNEDFSEGVSNLYDQECAILNREKSDSELKNQFSHLRTNIILRNYHVSNEQKSETETSNQLSMKLVDYNCSDSDSCSE